MSFSQYLKEVKVDCPDGIFAKVIPTTESILKIKRRFKSLNPLMDDLHCTAMYSKTPVSSVELPNIDKHERYDAVGTELVWWEGHDKEGYLVLKLDSKQLNVLNKKFRDAGLSGTFSDYKAHVTLLNPCKVQPSNVGILNKFLSKLPLHLEFYYGGYVLLDKKREE